MRPVDLPLQETLRFVSAHIRSARSRVLEVGCDNGELALRLKNLGHDVVAVDSSDEAIQQAKELGVDARFARWPEFEAEPFDAVLFTRSLQRFYHDVFGVKEYYRDASSIQVLGPGKHDVIAFEKNARGAGKHGGITHFGFRLLRASDIDVAVKEVERAGGKIIRRGEFAPGFPFAYVHDPDGYEIEIWYE